MENDSFQREIGGKEVGNGKAHPDAQGERNEEEGDETEGLPAAAFVREKQALEDARASERAGDGGGDTQLDEQGDEDEFVILHETRVAGSFARWHAQRQARRGHGKMKAWRMRV